MEPDSSNSMFQLATRFVNETSRNIFLTGKAGTGKTTFLKHIRDTCAKKMAVVAPTGVAAINANGVTIHSFFQLPLSPFIPLNTNTHSDEVADKHSLISRLRMTNEKRKVLEQLELLIIDEISMVRCDTLDAIDTVLRHIRHRPHEIFGGVQVIFIGDMFQLQPVIPAEEWNLLSQFYSTPFFFDSQVLKDHPPIYIEFKKIYRQTNQEFIDLLNNVRNNSMSPDDYKLLEERHVSNFDGFDHDGYIILTTHNAKADAINNAQLRLLEGDMHTFSAEVEDDFPEKAFPAEMNLNLKVGAQVMFLKNDTVDRRYFNGKIGEVTGFGDGSVFIKCEGQSSDIELKKEKWENIRYSVDASTRRLNEQLLGSFTQFPLRLAWAITIHKSQGLTFDKVIIDAGEAFTPGQVYVALSRCTNLSGVILKSRIRSTALITDKRLGQLQLVADESMLDNELIEARYKYEHEAVKTLFDLRSLKHKLQELEKYLRANTVSFNKEAVGWAEKLVSQINEDERVSRRFHLELDSIFSKEGLPGLPVRLKLGAGHFRKQMEQLLAGVIANITVTDSRIHAKEFNEMLREIHSQITWMIHMFGSCDNWSIDSWQEKKLSYRLPPFYCNAYSAKQSNEPAKSELYSELKKLRDRICNTRDLPVYLVASSKSLDDLVKYLPGTESELKKIAGFGDAKIKSFGKDFLEILNDHMQKHGLTSRVMEMPSKPKKVKNHNAKTVTKEKSLQLFLAGKTVGEIALERRLKISTVEDHLTTYIRSGELSIERFLDQQKLSLIEPHLENYQGESIIPLKERFGDAVSYGEIRMARAWVEYKKSAS